MISCLLHHALPHTVSYPLLLPPIEEGGGGVVWGSQGVDPLVSPLMEDKGEVELEEQGEDAAALMSKHMSGFEFLSLRPERRTVDMAKEWWEGELAILFGFR